MKKLIMMVLGLMCAVGMGGMAVAGNIDSPGPPSSGSGMYTLQQVYNYLSAGTTATIPGSFQEPSAGPGSTMKTTKEIYAAVATPFQQSNALPENVAAGTTFFGTKGGAWGKQDGTMLLGGHLGTWHIIPIPPGTTSWTAPEDGWIGGAYAQTASPTANFEVKMTFPLVRPYYYDYKPTGNILVAYRCYNINGNSHPDGVWDDETVSRPGTGRWLPVLKNTVLPVAISGTATTVSNLYFLY